MQLPTRLKNHWRSLIIFFAMIIAIQLVGNLVTMPAIPEWYRNLVRPSWSPPNWLFGPVWTLLYIMLAISGWLLWTQTPRSKALTFYFVQLFFNAVWSPLFFGIKQIEVAFACLVIMFVFALLTMVTAFKQEQKAVGWMFVPYCVWLLYATSLNGAIVVLN